MKYPLDVMKNRALKVANLLNQAFDALGMEWRARADMLDETADPEYPVSVKIWDLSYRTWGFTDRDEPDLVIYYELVDVIGIVDVTVLDASMYAGVSCPGYPGEPDDVDMTCVYRWSHAHDVQIVADAVTHIMAKKIEEIVWNIPHTIPPVEENK